MGLRMKKMEIGTAAFVGNTVSSLGARVDTNFMSGHKWTSGKPHPSLFQSDILLRTITVRVRRDTNIQEFHGHPSGFVEELIEAFLEDGQPSGVEFLSARDLYFNNKKLERWNCLGAYDIKDNNELELRIVALF